MSSLGAAIDLAIEAIGTKGMEFGPYKFAFIKPYMVIEKPFLVEGRENLVYKYSNDAYIFKKSGGHNRYIDHIGVNDGRFFYLFGLFEDKREVKNLYWLQNLIEGIVPLQFSKENMYSALRRNYDNLILWEYRSKRSKTQSYFKDENLDNNVIFERLDQDEKFNLKPYFASFRIRKRPKKFSFSINGDGMTSMSSTYFKTISKYTPIILNQLITQELEFLDFVRNVRMERLHSDVPSLHIGAKLSLATEFNVKKFKETTKSDFQTTFQRTGYNVQEGVVYDKFSGEFVTITSFPKTVYIFPKTTHPSKQRSLVADITYAVDNLFGPLGGNK